MLFLCELRGRHVEKMALQSSQLTTRQSLGRHLDSMRSKKKV
jgi:hypothetical protein